MKLNTTYLLFLFSLNLFIAIYECPVWAVQIAVCPTCKYSEIKNALAQSSAGDEIHVHPGRYRESRIVINKSVQLIGDPGAVIQGQPGQPGFIIFKADQVVIKGFRIENTGQSYTEELAGIRVIESAHCELSDNDLWNTNYGIYLEKAHGCRVLRNKIMGFAKDEAGSGNGIHVWTGSQHTIQNNTVGGHRDGIYLEFAQENEISNNKVEGNIRYGLHFMSSHNTVYSHNSFTNNGAGVAVMYSHHIKMKHNLFSLNKGASAYGLLLKEIKESEVEQNDFADNTVGIYMEGSNRSNFVRNNFRNNGWGLRIMGDCEGNIFKENNFLNNSFEVTTNADHSWNQFNTNYWSHFDGFDLNKDGYGDIPHYPVRFSSILLERIDSSYILLNSFLFSLLDSVERVFPEFTPIDLKDEQPLLKPKDTHDESGN